jgi:hypothetical protein
MSQEITNAFQALVDRLDDVLLEGVKLVEGPTEQAFGDEDLPAIIYEMLDGGFAEDTHFPKSARAQMTVLLTVMTKAEYGYTNNNGFGILDLYEKVMDAIDRGDSATDLTGGGKWGPIPPQYKVGGFERSGLLTTYLIEVKIQSNRYERGALRS